MLDNLDPYYIIIAAGALVILSFAFNYLSKITKIPSVLFLIVAGLLIKHVFGLEKIDIYEDYFVFIQLLGLVGLIMIVLEAAVDLNVSRSKMPVIGKSIVLALVVLVLSSLGIAFIIMHFLDEPFFNSFIYAIPLSVVSSAVLIPSVHSLAGDKKEFLIYEATFSDIIGIMFFNYVVIQQGRFFSLNGLLMILITIVLSVVFSYLLVHLFSKVKGHVKLFLMISILSLLFAAGKKIGLSSLLIIFIFGLILNNAAKFFRGPLAKYLDCDKIEPIRADFKVLTAETAFVVRTFFFVAFGMSIELDKLFDINVLFVGSLIVVILYLVRYINFRVFAKTNVFPEIFLAPRGLITILLFFAIPNSMQIRDFSVGILFFVILATSIIMMLALMKTQDTKLESLNIIDFAHDGVHPDNVEPSGPYCEIEDNSQQEKTIQ